VYKYYTHNGMVGEPASSVKENRGP
jgi:hypothetical protein